MDSEESGKEEEVAVRKVRLRSSDGAPFEIEERLARWSGTIADVLDAGCTEQIPLPNVSARIFSKVVAYCRKHADAHDNCDDFMYTDELLPGSTARDLKDFDREFIDVDQDTLFDMLLAANYLEVESLLKLASQAVANRMKERTPEQIRKIFNIKSDYTEEEEKKIRRELRWAFKHR